MIHILILIVLGLVTYLFHNYQEFSLVYIRPWAVQQVNFNREANPQALCDLLAPDATVIIKDQYTRYRYEFTGGKAQACEYFIESASHFHKPQPKKNGYIPDRFTEFKVDREDSLEGWFKDYADIGFTEDISYHSYGLVTVKNNETLIGKSHTKITVKSPIFKEKTITHYEFQRKLVQYSP